MILGIDLSRNFRLLMQLVRWLYFVWSILINKYYEKYSSNN